MERKMEVKIRQQLGSRFVEDEEYYDERVIRIQFILHCRNCREVGTLVPGGLVVEKSYSCCKEVFVNRDRIFTSLPWIMCQLVSPAAADEDGGDVLKVVGDNEEERMELFEKINSYVQCMPEPRTVRDRTWMGRGQPKMRVAAELVVEITIQRCKKSTELSS